MDRKIARGFSLVELMIVVAIVGVLASIAIPSFVRYIRRSKTSEAALNIRKLFDSAVAYYGAEHADANGNLLAKNFSGNAGPTPVFPGATRCCLQPGGKCQPNSTQWTVQGWQELNFAIDDPHIYHYRSQRVGGTGAVVGDQWIAQAQGDQDCDGFVFATFQRGATVGVDRSLRGGSGLYEVSPNE
ncbi:MAG: prepilin-type N-terminal cleavage/methylation domain-containing protein [Myxococcales bacterium]|nr:prepilin-type N-terminal cleavage/methylation domain-containing protein [Myxococcales bacterium]